MTKTPPRLNLRRLALAASVILLVGATLVAAALLLSREARFLARAGYEEIRILLGRRPIDGLLSDSSVPRNLKERFRLVLDAREFAADSLGLTPLDTYTTFYDVGRDTLLVVLSASPRDRLAPYTWRYPIVGTIPYKGYFSSRQARAEAARLEEQGYDTYLRTAGAFSTLGWFGDPLLSTALSDDPARLAATVFHEIAHNTLYVRGATEFNESFASFVGWKAALAFFESRDDSANAARARAVWRDELKLSRFYADLADSLRASYERARDPSTVEETRRRLFSAARERLQDSLALGFEVYRPTRLAQRELNNASVIAALIYRTGLHALDRILAEEGGDLRAAIGRIAGAIETGRERDPFDVLRELL